MFFFIILIILLILVVLNILLLIKNTNNVKGGMEQEIISATPSLLRYNEYFFNGNDECFEKINELITVAVYSDIDYSSELYLYCKQFEHFDILLNNFLVLFDKISTPIKKRSILESCWTCNDFEIVIAEYDRFKTAQPANRKSYFFYWINLINISSLLVKFKYDISLEKYSDAEQQCTDQFELLKLSLLMALSCRYDDVLSLYKKLILYIYCANEDSKTHYSIDIKSCIDILLQSTNTENCVFLLLSMNRVQSTKYGIFEGTKFLISCINPLFKADGGIYGNILPFICHDAIIHKVYAKKNILTDINEEEFKQVCRLAILHKFYPLVLGVIHEIFHEEVSVNPFSLDLFVKKCIQLLLFPRLYKTSSNNLYFVDGVYDALYDLAEINNDIVINLLTFLINITKINEEQRDQIIQYRESIKTAKISKEGIFTTPILEDMAPYIEQANNLYTEIIGSPLVLN